MTHLAITPKLYAQWRAARRGDAHGQRLNNPVWEWLIRERQSAYAANADMEGPSSFDNGPAWCFQRMGQTQTLLPDGRTLYFAGEHEDHYDPDFYIYNDVVLVGADGSIDVFGYPETEVPPTDFHTATLMGSRLVVVGNLGYPRDRLPGATQVLTLDLETMRVTKVMSSGEVPGWISDHSARLEGTEIIIRGGTFYDAEPLENIDEWALDLGSWLWTRRTDHAWPRLRFTRSDGSANDLFNIEQFEYYSSLAEDDEYKRNGLASRLKALGAAPDLDLFRSRYRPSVAHELVPDAETLAAGDAIDEDADEAADDDDDEGESEFGVYRISVDGVVVRFNESMYTITMTVEGTLPDETLASISEELRDKLAALERTPYALERLKGR